MPRELARRSVQKLSQQSSLQYGRQEAASRQRKTLEMDVGHTERTVRVTLSGILDRKGVEEMSAKVATRLAGRGYRVILDGSGLTHLDYRATASLLEWNRKIRRFRHQLYLLGWSDYLKAILVMEDWDLELGVRPAVSSTLRLLAEARTQPMP